MKAELFFWPVTVFADVVATFTCLKAKYTQGLPEKGGKNTMKTETIANGKKNGSMSVPLDMNYGEASCRLHFVVVRIFSGMWSHITALENHFTHNITKKDTARERMTDRVKKRN